MLLLIFLLQQLLIAVSPLENGQIPPAPLIRPKHYLRNYGIMRSVDVFSKQYPYLIQAEFTQKLDHFDPLNFDTWQQRYYYNPKYYRNNSIIFLMIGGEGPEDGKWAAKPDVQYLQWANKYGAAVFDLEHRFFGKSWPKPNMNFDSLKLLTTQQALKDIAYFIRSMNVKYGFTNPRWVTFGGSYPGSLSAWFRSKYPDLTVGAVASSAPLNLKLNMYEYAMVVENDLKITNPECPAAVKMAFDQMQKLSMTKAGRSQLNTYFKLTPPFDGNTTKLDITNFFANVYSVFQSMTQYTYDGQSNNTEHKLTDKRLCEIMLNKNEPDVIKRVYNIYQWYNTVTQQGNVDVFPNSYWDMINSVKSGDLKRLGDDNAASRGWLWLSCNELGFMQTTDQGDNIFGSTVPLNYFIDMCSDMFDPSVKMTTIYARNAATQKYYGGSANYQATNIVLPNGSMDPWHALGMYKSNTTNHVTPILINGTAHCSDMYPAYEGEPPALKGARTQIQKEIEYFIQWNGVSINSLLTSLAFVIFISL